MRAAAIVGNSLLGQENKTGNCDTTTADTSGSLLRRRLQLLRGGDRGLLRRLGELLAVGRTVELAEELQLRLRLWRLEAVRARHRADVVGVGARVIHAVAAPRRHRSLGRV